MIVDKEGSVLWFTGLSGAGKTTTARALVEPLRQSGYRVELLDGDELRDIVSKGLGFKREDRLENIKRIVYISRLLSRHGVTVLVSTISPYNEMRAYARSQLSEFIEVYVDCSLEECERRDVKGLYAKARSQEIAHFTGISDPYESPEHPEVHIYTEGSRTLEQNVDAILQHLKQKANMTPLQREEAAQ